MAGRKIKKLLFLFQNLLPGLQASPGQGNIFLFSTDEKLNTLESEEFITDGFNGVQPEKLMEKVFELIREIQPDLICTDLHFGIYTAELAEVLKIPFVLYLDNHNAICPSPSEMANCDKNCKGCKFYLDNISLQENRKKAFQKADIVFTTDINISETVYDFYGRKVKVGEWSETELLQMFSRFFQDKRTASANTIKVVWEGSQFLNHSFAIGNREIELELMKIPEIDLSVLPYEKHSFTEKEEPRFEPVTELFYKKHEKNDIVVRFKWPPDFSEPAEGKLVILQTWEAGSMPLEWLEPFSVIADEVWTTSDFNSRVYIESGIPEEKVFTLPFGVAKELFTRQVEAMELPSPGKFRFLFIGGTIYRKGVDILLNAYLEEFSQNEDVSLVIKDIGVKNVYASTYRDEILKITENDKAAEIIYLDNDFSEEELLSLYKACDCYVQPYRGEGFGMPIVEAMANSMPVIVPEYGPALEFCTTENSYLIPVELIYPSENKYFETDTVGSPYYAEVKKEQFKKQMRHVFNNRQEAIEKGKKARSHIFENFTWEHSARKAADRLKKLREKPELRNNRHYYSDMYLAKADKHTEAGEFELAAKYYQQALFLDKNSNLVKSRLAMLDYKKGHYDKAVQAFMKLIQSGFREKEMFEILVKALEKLGDSKTAAVIKNNFLV